MQRTTTCVLLVSAALIVVLVLPNCARGSEAASTSSHDSDSSHELFDEYQVGGGEEPAAFRTVGSGWSNTSGGFSPFGEPAILSWSIVPDQTVLPQGQSEPLSPSNLIAFLDGIHHGGAGPGGSDLTQRDWFPLIKSAFDRWDAVSGLKFSYEPSDDGVVNGIPTTALASALGVSGVRGDHRIGGHSIDGSTSPTIVAYNYFPSNSDMVLDTDEAGRFGNPSDNYLRFRNTLMHEIGHGIGLNHVASAGHNFLMEGFLDTSIDGPQFDDILGAHRLYGDRFEEDGGNDSPSLATPLGSFALGQSVSLGADAVDAAVAPTDIDFLSINKSGDNDYFRFSVASPSLVDILLTPLGPTYPEGPHGGTETPFDASAKNNLRLYLYNSTGNSLLGFSTGGGLGAEESLINFALPAAGDYLIQIAGLQDAAQFYQLDLAVVPEPTSAILLFAALTGWIASRRQT
ncbi:matrixin family metalloprotease [Bythopirellula goksoeyrii]|uniref:Matrixin n=1 Tax=Bythopirellula goksoeyrii TaxID=1400387 RepID=A0A5B9QCD8_9BACT|nr:matrixin family metalloprotease [Bythopirellula goksoeyrii]QEG36727.1 Matrixin [Bythopirellula goksoeyrii]